MTTTSTTDKQRLPLTKLNRIPRDRKERRQAQRETLEQLRILMKIDLAFTTALLEDGDKEYEELYHDYLQKWNEALRRIDVRNYKLVSPCRTYFADSFSKKNQ